MLPRCTTNNEDKIVFKYFKTQTEYNTQLEKLNDLPRDPSHLNRLPTAKAFMTLALNNVDPDYWLNYTSMEFKNLILHIYDTHRDIFFKIIQTTPEELSFSEIIKDLKLFDWLPFNSNNDNQKNSYRSSI